MNIEDLISQYIDGTLSSDAEAELHHHLAVSPESRRLFRAHMMLRGVARDQRVLHTPAPEVRNKLFDRLAREEGMTPASVPLPPVAAAVPKMAPPAPSPAAMRQEKPERRRRRPLPWLIPAMIAGIFLVFLWSTDRFGIPSESEPQLADGGMGGGTGAAVERRPSDATVHSAPGSAPEAAHSSPATSAPAVPQLLERPMAAAPRRGGVGSVSGRTAAPVSSTRSASRHEAAKDIAALQTSDADNRTMKDDGAGASIAMMTPPPPSSVMSAQSPDGTASDIDVRPQSAAETVQAETVTAEGNIADMNLGPTLSSPELAMMRESENGGGENSPVLSEQRTTLGGDDASKQERTLLDDFVNSFKKINPTPTSLGLERTNSYGASKRKPSSAIFALPAELANALSAFDSAADASHMAPSVAPQMMDEPGPGPLTLTIGFQQHSLMSLSSPDVHLQVLLKAGVELGGGDHQVYGLVSGRNYRESSSDSLIGATYEGQFFPAELVQPLTGESRREVIEDERNELWVGGGYRYSHEIAKGWRVGVGVWSGAGARYIRVGSELPVAYQPVHWIRVEILPTVQYTAAHGERSVTTINEFEPRAGYVEQSKRTTVLENERELNFGIGIGAALLW